MLTHAFIIVYTRGVAASGRHFLMMSAGNNMRLLEHFDLVKPRKFHKTSQTGINYDTRLFLHFCNEKPRSLHKTSQTGINYDTRLLIYTF